MSDFIPDRLNEPPSVFNGCTWLELGIAAALAAAVSLFLGIILALLLGTWIVILGLLPIGTLAGIYLISKLMMGAKRGKPVGYHKTKLHLLFQAMGFRPKDLITESRVWDIGR